ncbi:PREDICTED: protein mahjong isoform X1 [Rhagoletis zephyria]|uniref:protein mahjong isoform X1 n=2 Tax=Rhagoletis zephyria TaxID=28612 RepID=UPI00081143F3|nr:PREDICTED: protein mahjong isoform X1 [Rhagoletis zephyria]
MPPNNIEPVEHPQSDAEMRDEEDIQPTSAAEAETPTEDSTQQRSNGSEGGSNADEGQPSTEASADTDTEMNGAVEEGSSSSVAANVEGENGVAAGNEVAGDNEEAGDEVAAVAADADPFYGFEDEEPNFDSKDMAQVLQIWEAQHTRSGYDPVPVLKRLAEIFEKEKETYMRKDHDPFEDRHPYRTDPKCQFGVLLKQLFRKDVFMNKLVNDYLRDNFFTRQNIQKSSLELNILACRLILVIAPGLETSAVFQGEFEHLIHRIFGWAEDSIEPLQSYATGLLGAAMEVTEIAVSFKEHNTRLIPKVLKRLHMLQAFYKPGTECGQSLAAQLPTEPNSANNSFEQLLPPWITNDVASLSSPQADDQAKATTSAEASASQNFKNTLDTHCSNSNMSTLLENSRDAFPQGSGSRYYKKIYIPLHPPTAESSQALMLRYVTALGNHQDYLGLVFEHRAMQFVFGYLKNLDRRDSCLAFEALKYLASLLCHKKFALEFIAHGGLELLLKVPRPSIAATGVSITLYYLAYTEEAMERICSMPRNVIVDLVHYALWLMERSYDSGVCHATMFFGLSFQFKVILDEFDSQDGLRKLYNVISILKILNPSNNDDDENPVDDDVECASRQLVRHVCVALKRYMESHLFYKYNNFMRQQCSLLTEFSQNIVTKAAKASLEQISEQVRTLQEHTSVRAHWAPVDKLLKVSGITLLLKIIALSYDWNNSVRSEIVRSALDVLSICCVIPRVFLVYCERLDVPDSAGASGIYFILAAASGDITADADVQKSALAVLVHCVCAPLARKEPNNVMKVFSSTKRNKQNNRYCEELIEKVWESVCSNNGIIILLSLMQIKAPITDADCIRGMACRALAGLARSERVRQIVGKLTLFANGQIQTLMRDPILQEKRAEHVLFQKYALELVERVSGKTKPISSKMDPSLANIHKANVIAQTKIQYNEQQLYQLIHDHLESKGLLQTAQVLQKEAGLPQTSLNTTKNFHQSPFDYKVVPSSTVRQRLRSRMQDVNNAINSIANAPTNEQQQLNNSLTVDEVPTSSSSVTPIKLVKKSEKTSAAPNSTASTAALAIANANAQRSLQKQISSLPDDVHSESGSPAPQHSNQTGITLGTIVTEYLTNQHALCNNPMTTCPQFDLFTPHKCPDPKPNRVGDNLNLTARIFKAQAGYNTARLDRRYVHSNFAPWRSVRSNDFPSLQFSTCEIVSPSKLLLVGTHRGEVKAFNLSSGAEIFSSVCHSYVVDSINSNRAGDLVLTSCSWRSPLSVLWSIKHNEFASKLSFADDYYCEFNNLTQDKVLGTQNDCAIIYDINTGNKISAFTPTLGNQYVKNRATFCPTDELILSDGVLWDVRSGKEIHKLDKLNQCLSGVFHPNGLEIISNTEVWDLRTFHLLQTVPVLDQCFLKFSPMRVMYSYNAEASDERIDAMLEELPACETSFKVLDAYDYSSISTIDVRRGIYDMSINDNGSLIALVENQPAYDSRPETFVKIYAVGMKKIENQEEVRHGDASCIAVGVGNDGSNSADRAADLADADDYDDDNNPGDIAADDGGGRGEGDRADDGLGRNQNDDGHVADADNNRRDGDHIRRFGRIREINIDIDASRRHNGGSGGGGEEIIVSFRSSALPAAASGNGGVGVVIGRGSNGHAAPRPSAAGGAHGARLAPAALGAASRGGAGIALRANRYNRGVAGRAVGVGGSGSLTVNGNAVRADIGIGAGAATVAAQDLIDAIMNNWLPLLSGR